jgi:hypothetical protein
MDLAQPSFRSPHFHSGSVMDMLHSLNQVLVLRNSRQAAKKIASKLQLLFNFTA